MKTLIGMITFGNLPFTQLAIREIQKTTQADYEFFIVVGKPDDLATAKWLDDNDIPYTFHSRNWGMPYSLNDIYDRAFMNRFTLAGKAFDNVIFVGNDVIVYPGAIDAMIAEAARGEYDWICASEYSVKSLCADYPAAIADFDVNANYKFTDFTRRPWDLHAHKVPATGTADRQADTRKDVRNLCLYTRKSFDVLGYADVNFWPGGYFEDNDYGRRGDLAGVKACGLPTACYFHFWSRTIHQGQGTQAVQFGRNSDHYQKKWGGPVGAERHVWPHNIPGTPISIPTRLGELEQVEHWMRL